MDTAEAADCMVANTTSMSHDISLNTATNNKVSSETAHTATNLLDVFMMHKMAFFYLKNIKHKYYAY